MMGRISLWACCVIALCSGSAVGQTVYVSEVVADNKNTLVDEDGASPDWIEIHNATDSAIDLAGWFLSDDPAELDAWSFPATNLAAKGFLVVFASEKDRAVSGSELHARFKLSGDGEQVILTRPDGTTIEHQMSFPPLGEDVAFGYGFSSSSAEPVSLLNTGAPCAAHVPTGPTDAAGWEQESFNESGWLTGTTGVGYDYPGLIGLDAESVIRGVNGSMYIRVPFTVAEPAAITALTLKMKYDEGFVAYLNGVEVAKSATAPQSPAWNSTCAARSDEESKTFEAFNLDANVSALQAGANVLAIHGMNYHVSSSDFLILPELEAAQNDGDIDATAAGLLTSPTPGFANTVILYDGVVTTPVTYPQRGFYDAPVQVSVSNSTAGATIRYTTNGSEPTSSSPVYTGPITISATTCLRVRAFRADWKPSLSRTDTYIFVDDVVTQPESETEVYGQTMIYGMDQDVVNATYHDASGQGVTVQDSLKSIPSISLTTDEDYLYGDDNGVYVNASTRFEVPVSAELIHPDGSEGFQINAGLRVRGGWSRHRNYPKHALRLFFRDAYGKGKLQYPLFEDEGVDEFKKIDLRTAINYDWAHNGDARNTFLRDIFSRDTAGAMEQEYTRSRFFHLYLNGLYWGLYMTEERPVADFGASYNGGDSDDYDAIKNTNWVDPDPPTPYYSVEATDGTTDAYYRLYAAAMAGFADNADYFAVQGMNAAGERDPAHERLLDVDNMIDYLLLIYYTGASDNCITKFLGGNQVLNNLYAYYNRVNPDGFKWIQHDCEHSLDRSTSLDRTGPFNNSNYQLAHYFNAMTLHEKLSVNEEYRMKFADRVYKHMFNGGALVRTNCEARLDVRAAQIDRAIIANSARWGSPSLDRDTWVSAVASARAFFARSGDRCNEVIGYLDADGLIPSISPPAISRAGGEVVEGAAVGLSASEGTIYFTTNGLDPRAIGGAVDGLTYSSPLAITRPTQLKARCRGSNGAWSALAEATYWTPEVPLAVTEVMYHAPDGNPHDFIEIQNISDEPVSLKGYKLDNAIDFKFKTASQPSLGPGEYMLAVDDIDAFATTYPTNGITIAGEFSGDLSNGGEKVDLEFRNNDMISFTYDDARNWPQAADGAGHSLVPLASAMDDQERGSLDYGGNWRASTFTNGSPGYADPVLGATVVINEITAHTDTGLAPPFESNDKIELYNPTANLVNLGGWSLSDDGADLDQYVIPAGTTIPAGGFKVFDEDDFHTDRVNGFGLNKAGEQVYLTHPNRGVVDAIRFKGQENGVSLGRYPDGAPHWMITQPTPAAANVPYAVPFQIVEVMYNPLPGAKEYLVIKNIGGGSAPLENEVGAYRIDGGVAYDFSTGVSLAADESIWIVGFDPADTVQLAAFKAMYGLSGGDRVFGPYKGDLSNRGERVALERPQDSDDPTRPWDISWVVVDELYYFDQDPWPTSADGTGYPLVRVDPTTWSAPSATDSDADRMDDTWEIEYFGSLEQGNPDWDGDGQSNYDEFVADTDPTNAASMFVLDDLLGETVSWTAKPGRTYSIWWSDDLSTPFVQIAAGLTTGSYTDIARAGCSFYRVKVELQ